MAITYKWLVHGFFTAAQDNGQFNVIKRVIFELEATDGVLTSRVRSGAGWLDFAPVSADGFVQYEDFTPDMISSWLDNNVPDIDALREEARLKIEDQYLPVVATKTAPWKTTEQTPA